MLELEAFNPMSTFTPQQSAAIHGTGDDEQVACAVDRCGLLWSESAHQLKSSNIQHPSSREAPSIKYQAARRVLYGARTVSVRSVGKDTTSWKTSDTSDVVARCERGPLALREVIDLAAFTRCPSMAS